MFKITYMEMTRNSHVMPQRFTCPNTDIAKIQRKNSQINCKIFAEREKNKA